MSNTSTLPLVTIQCLIYNHEPYIRQCLEGFVMQKTNFRFEAVVHDDASTDGTANIIREYAEKYPDIIKPIYETENQYSKHDGSLSRIMDEHTHGKYIAFCEGDDYWTDPLKLQKQVDFLESHPEYSMCFHRAANLLYIPVVGMPHNFNIEDRDYTAEEITVEWTVPTCSIVARRECLDYPIKHREKLVCGDIPFILSCTAMGKIRGGNDFMSVYRVHSTGVVNNPNVKKNGALKYPDHLECLAENFPDICTKRFYARLALGYWDRVTYRETFKEKWSDTITAIKYYPPITRVILGGLKRIFINKFLYRE